MMMVLVKLLTAVIILTIATNSSALIPLSMASINGYESGSGFDSESGDNSSILTTSITQPSTSTIISSSMLFIEESSASFIEDFSSIFSLTIEVTTSASIISTVETIATTPSAPSSSFAASFSPIVSPTTSVEDTTLTPSSTLFISTTTSSAALFSSFTFSSSSVTPPTLTTTPQLSTTLTNTTFITPSITPLITSTPSITPSITPLITSTPSITPSITPLITSTPSITPSITPLITSTPSITPSITPLITSTPSITPSITPLITSTPSITPSITPLITSTPSTSITPSITPLITSTPSTSITPSITPLITSTPSTSITPSITPLITSTTSTSSVVPSTAPPGPFDLSTIVIIIAVIVIILLIVIVILFISVIFYRKRNRVKDDELGQLIDGPGNVIILSNISSNGYDPRSLFSHIPVLPSVELNRLENYVKNLEDGETASDEFMELQEHGHDLPQTKADLNVNSAKNRYINILPYDATRVVLSTVNKKEGSDYINANYIQGYNHRYEYIATQGPLPYTINDFWRMIWEKECEVIVMVTNPVEGGNTKCEVYWPEEQHTSQYGGISVTHLEEEIQPSCTKRTFLLSLPEKSDNSKRDLTSRNCIQFHFTSWPDMGVPNDAGTMLRFVRNVRATARNSDKPIVVHCSAGVGRTGTYIAIDILMQRMTEYHNVNVQELILQMRAQRISMVQTMPQYVFIYMCLLYEYLYGETEVKREELSDHLEKLLEVFPETEDSRMDKEFEGAQRIIEPDSSILEYATHADNVSKNRPGAGIPLDLNRVCLSDPHETGNDYINASFIGCISRRAEYILTQHPLKNTTEDFWRMILDRHVNTVVVIGNVKDEDEYWPGEKQFEWEDLTVKLVEVDEMDDIKICGVEVEHEISEEYQMVTIFQLTDWPSESETVPTSPKSLLNLVNIIAEHKKGLVLIHTAAGVSNEASGVFAVINTLVHYLREPERKVNIMEVVRRTLQQRPGCISTKEQYEFIYECLIHSIDNS